MNRRKTLLAILLIALIISAGFILPSAISGIYDKKDASGSSSVEVETIKLDPGQSLSIAQRINMLGGDHNETAVSTGRLLTEEDVTASTAKFILSLTDALGLDVGFDGYASSATPCLVVSSDASIFSTIVIWSVIMEADSGSFISAVVDEESGLILGANCSIIGSGYGVDAPWPAAPDEMCRFIAKMYGAHLGLYLGDSNFEYTSDKTTCYMYCTLYSGSESCSVVIICDPYGFSISPDYYESETESYVYPTSPPEPYSAYEAEAENDAALMP